MCLLLKRVSLLSCCLNSTCICSVPVDGFLLIITTKAVLMWHLYPSFCLFLPFSHSFSVLSISLRLVEPELVLSARHRGIFTFLVPFASQNFFISTPTPHPTLYLSATPFQISLSFTRTSQHLLQPFLEVLSRENRLVQFIL